MFELLIDKAFEGNPQPFMFCDGLILELYEEDDELKWREYGPPADKRGKSNNPG